MQPTVPIQKDLVLVGGGHSHALVLRQLGMNPWTQDVRLTLITNLTDTPYSGMLPCHISGIYDFDTAHIDLRPLTRFAHCRLVMDEMVGLDLQRQQVLCREHPPLAFDTLSIDIGSTPAKSQVPGAAQHAIPAKPVPDLLKAWASYLAKLEQDLASNPQRKATISIVGGGVGGVEMAFAMQVRLQQLMRDCARPSQNRNYKNNYSDQIAVHIFQRSPHLAKGRNSRTQRLVERLCKAKQIHVHTNQSVCEVTADAVRCESGLVVPCDRTFWVTNASAPPWLKESGLALTDNGFLAVRDTLQSCSHANVFAAGDVATMVNHPRPKAGVFAVRQGPPLYENLKRQVSGRPLKPFQPQRRYLNIIDTDRESAIASWGPFAIHAKWCRAWKNRIDQKFMATFSDFPNMETDADADANGTALTHSRTKQPHMHCAGCGSKIGASVLSQVLERVRSEAPSDAEWPDRAAVLAGLDAPDDAAIVQVPNGKLLVHTVDHFSALVDDPFIFGQICVNHCLSDLFAMGATSHNVLASATIPYGSDAKQAETLYQLLSGAMLALAEAQTFLVGGHTTEGPQLSLGFACNGWIEPDQIWRKSGMVTGQSLILTKALGTGTLFAADQQKQAKGRWIEAAVESMLRSNRLAADCLRQWGATACTDVTGFGLAGHLLEMMRASGVSIVLDLNQISLLPGAAHSLGNGWLSSLHQRNVESAIASIQPQNSASYLSLSPLPQFQILFDPQTSGGLLASIPVAHTDQCLSALHRIGYTQSRCIGTVDAPADRPVVAVKPTTIAG